MLLLLFTLMTVQSGWAGPGLGSPTAPTTPLETPTCSRSDDLRGFGFSDLNDMSPGLYAWVHLNDKKIALCCVNTRSVRSSYCEDFIAEKTGSYSNTSRKGSYRQTSLEKRLASDLEKARDKNERAEEAKRDAAQEARNRGYAAAARKTAEDKAKTAKEKYEDAKKGKRVFDPVYTVSKGENVPSSGVTDPFSSGPHSNGQEITLTPSGLSTEQSLPTDVENSVNYANSRGEIDRSELKAARTAARQAARNVKAIDRVYDERKECGNFGGTSCKATDNGNALANEGVKNLNTILQMNVENRNAEAQSAVTQKGFQATQEDALRANAQAAWNSANAAQNSAMVQGGVAIYKGVRTAQHARSASAHGRVQEEITAKRESYTNSQTNAKTPEEAAYWGQKLSDLEDQGSAELAAQSEKAGTQVVETGNSLAGMATKIFEAIQGKRAQKNLNDIADGLPKNQGGGFTFWNPNSTDANTNQDQMQVTEVPNGAVTSNIPIDENVVAPENLYDPNQLDQGAAEGSASPYAASPGAAPAGAGLSGLAGGGGGTSAAQSEDKNEAPIKNGSAGKYAAGEGGSKARGGSGAIAGAKIGLQGIEKSLQDLMNQALADKKEEIKKGVDPTQRVPTAEGSYVHGRDTDIFKKVTESYQRHAPELPSS